MGQRVPVGLELGAEPGGHRGVVRHGAARGGYHGHRRGAVYAWVRSSTPDVDLQATISEVRPDGNETFVQNGYMRGSERELSTDSNNMFKEPSTLLNPIPSFMAADASPMPSDSFVQVAIPLYYQGHVYRAGSRIRVTIAAPNGAQPVWSFSQSVPTGKSTVAIAYSPIQPSTLVLPVIPGSTAHRRRCRRARACATSRAGRTYRS